MLCMRSAVAASTDLTSLPAEVAALIERLQQQARGDAQELARRSRELTLAQAKLNFELARLRRWQFDANTEAMTVRHLMRRPLARLSLTKSMLQTSLMERHSCSGTRSSCRRCLPRRLRTDRSASL